MQMWDDDDESHRVEAVQHPGVWWLRAMVWGAALIFLGLALTACVQIAKEPPQGGSMDWDGALQPDPLTWPEGAPQGAGGAS